MCREYEVGVVPWSPLAWGFLTGKYRRDGSGPSDSKAAEDSRFADAYLTDENFDALDVVETVTAEVDATPAQVSLAWLMRHPQVTAPIVGARTVDQLEENLGASEVSLTDEQFDRLAVATSPPGLGKTV